MLVNNFYKWYTAPMHCAVNTPAARPIPWTVGN